MAKPTTNYLAEIETTIAGIPCIVAVTDYEAYTPAYVSGPPENCYPSEGGYGGYEVLDRKGYRAQWLERKITSRIENSIQDEIFNHFEG
jgi:hypothetical protein